MCRSLHWLGTPESLTGAEVPIAEALMEEAAPTAAASAAAVVVADHTAAVVAEVIAKPKPATQTS